MQLALVRSHRERRRGRGVHGKYQRRVDVGREDDRSGHGFEARRVTDNKLKPRALSFALTLHQHVCQKNKRENAPHSPADASGSVRSEPRDSPSTSYPTSSTQASTTAKEWTCDEREREVDLRALFADGPTRDVIRLQSTAAHHPPLLLRLPRQPPRMPNRGHIQVLP